MLLHIMHATYMHARDEWPIPMDVCVFPENTIYKLLLLSDISCVLLSFLSETSSCGHIWQCWTCLAGTGLNSESIESIVLFMTSNGAKEFSRIIANELNRCGSVFMVQYFIQIQETLEQFKL